MQIFINKTMMKLLLYCISSSFKIDCIYLLFLPVFDVSCFDLGGLIKPLTPLPLDPPKKYNVHICISDTKTDKQSGKLKEEIISKYLV